MTRKYGSWREKRIVSGIEDRFVSVRKLEKGTKKGFKIRERLKIDETKMDNTRDAEAGYTKSSDDKCYFRRSLEFWGCTRVNMIQHRL
jgi:hypothetical protein